MATSTREHDTFPYDGGLRCRRCGHRVPDSGAGKPPCDPVTWESEVFAIRHVVGEGGACGRCGDPNVLFADEPVGREYIYRDSNTSLPDGTHSFAISGSLAQQPHLETTPRCEGKGFERLSPTY